MKSNFRSFMDLSTEVVTNFIQNVIVIDDKAKYEITSDIKAKPLNKPKRQGGRNEEEKSDIVETQTSEAQKNKLNAKEVIDSFAKKGIICSVIKPDDNDHPWSGIEEVIKKADALILDWELYDIGENAIEILEKIILEESTNGPRLRLIIVYTGEKIRTVSDKIQSSFSGNSRHQLNSDDSGYVFTLNHLRISIFGKENVQVEEANRERIVEEKNLPEVLIKEFTEITKGLISNVAIESLAVLRRNTPLILGKLGPEMDPPYLTHRAWLPNPGDAMDFAMNIICSEFYSILDHAEVGEKANLEAIKAWLKYKDYGEEITLHLQNADRKVSFEKFIELLERGVEDVNKDCVDTDKITNRFYRSFTKTFCQNDLSIGESFSEDLDKKANNFNCEFTMLTCLQQQYGGNENKPLLTAGTILKEFSTRKHWLCLQPRCDCVRIKEDSRNFFFLQLEKKDGNSGFDLVLPDTDSLPENAAESPESKKQKNYIKFGITYKIYDSILLNFKPNYDNKVRWAEQEGTQYYFITTDGKRFSWISEMKDDHIQKILNNFAAEIARVGINEFEWSRRWNGNN